MEQGCRQRGAGGASAPQYLTDQLTLSQQGGGRLCPPQYKQPPRIFRPCDGPVGRTCLSSPCSAKRRASDKDLPVQLKKMQLNKEKGLKRLEVMLEDMENVLVELKKMVDNCLTHTKLCDNPPPSVTLGKNFFLLSLIQIQI